MTPVQAPATDPAEVPRLTPEQVWELADQATGDPNDPDWSAALCAQVDPEAWFPEPNTSVRELRGVCCRCDLQADCLAYALIHDERFGVWGGVTEQERRKAKRWARSRVVAHG